MTGTVSYRQRIALTPGAVIEVKLLDVSRADTLAVTIGEQTIKPAGRQVPIAFDIRYDPSRIVARNRYVIHARILEGGQLKFINAQAYPVITDGNPTSLNVMVGRRSIRVWSWARPRLARPAEQSMFSRAEPQGSASSV